MSRFRRAAARIGAPALAAAALAGTAALSTALAPAAAAASAWPMPAWPAGPYTHPTWGQLVALQNCESGGNYGIDTGNGFYGAYQFDVGTWHSLGLPGTPNQAPAEVQDRAAAVLEVQRGWAPWPACSRALGLTAAHVTREPATPLRNQHIEAVVADDTVHAGDTAWFGGQLTPVRDGVELLLQRYDGGWHTVDHARTNDHGNYLFATRTPGAGDLSYRIVVNRGGGFATAVTPSLHVHAS